MSFHFLVAGAPNGVNDNIFASGGWAELDDSPVTYHVTEARLLFALSDSNPLFLFQFLTV